MTIPGARASDISLSRAEFDRLRALVYDWTGMTFSENKRYFFERRISERLRQTGASNVAAYLSWVPTSVGEREQLINSVTINETYFYREEHQLAALSKEILPTLVRTRQPGGLVRIWSMPCSTGEETYSIAIWLLENWPLVDAYNIEIVGSDIDTSAIAAAKAGRFSARSLARLPAELIERYFEEERGHRRKIIDDLRESVRFRPTNLVDSASTSALGKFDVILCRNLLIYFDDASRLIAASNLFDCLTPGGFLCLGHSESMARISDRFTFVRLEDAIVYRRP